MRRADSWIVARRVTRRSPAVAAFVQVADRAAKLLGADRPIKIATTPDGDLWAPLELAVSKLSTEKVRVLYRLAKMRVLPPAGSEAVEIETLDE